MECWMEFYWVQLLRGVLDWLRGPGGLLLSHLKAGALQRNAPASERNAPALMILMDWNLMMIELIIDYKITLCHPKLDLGSTVCEQTMDPEINSG